MELSLEQLLEALGASTAHGVAAVVSKEKGRVEVWWGDRVKCLGLSARLSYNVQEEMDDIEESEEDALGDPDCDEDEEEVDELAREFPQLGQYL